eukprot:5796716-Amphidinium_carterae.1
MATCLGRTAWVSRVLQATKSGSACHTFNNHWSAQGQTLIRPISQALLFIMLAILPHGPFQFEPNKNESGIEIER